LATFNDLGITKPFLDALAEANITEPSDIQIQTIPILLRAPTDFVGQAQTGTGKTIAFGLPLLMKVDPADPRVQALVLAPTRELCQQISKQLFKLTKFKRDVFITAVYGGEKIEDQLYKLSKPTQIVVATPGRLLDLLERKALDLQYVENVVLDEADEMISMGFKTELETILKQSNEQSFTWMFSATIPEELNTIVETYMGSETQRIQINKRKVINSLIEHQYLICHGSHKTEYLTQFLQSQIKMSGMIFCKTKAMTATVAKQLIAKNISAGALHGDLEQRDRDKVMRAFKNGKLKYLVATDIAARGIDIEDLGFVVHYQLPDEMENYTHRSGRTARAGKRGISIAFVDPVELKRLKVIEKALTISFVQIK
jgi:ATP-dependent RNA helicase DeaD